jgi:hypothetical protein
MPVSCEFCVLSGGGLCAGPITRPECYREASAMRRPWPPRGSRDMEKNN